MKQSLILLLSLMTAFNVQAQDINEELGFIYVKADYLLETNRYDEAIAEFTKIVNQDPSFKDALYKRADAKFHVAAFQGAKNDLLSVFDVKGVTSEALVLFGKTQKNLGDMAQSEVTLATANASMSPNKGTTSSNPPRRNDRQPDRSSDNEQKTELEKIGDKITDILSDIVTTENGQTGQTDQTGRTDDRPRSDDTRTPTQRDTSSDRGDGSYPNDRDVVYTQPDPEPEPVRVDRSVNEIIIDDEVTLEIKNGIGARKILEMPSILILSETSGSVVVDICINRNGKVSSAEYNKGTSTLHTQSIISLAVRKAKEFWFEKSGQDEMCGTIEYIITGSS